MGLSLVELLLLLCILLLYLLLLPFLRVRVRVQSLQQKKNSKKNPSPVLSAPSYTPLSAVTLTPARFSSATRAPRKSSRTSPPRRRSFCSLIVSINTVVVYIVVLGKNSIRFRYQSVP